MFTLMDYLFADVIGYRIVIASPSPIRIFLDHLGTPDSWMRQGRVIQVAQWADTKISHVTPSEGQDRQGRAILWTTAIWQAMVAFLIRD